MVKPAFNDAEALTIARDIYWDDGGIADLVWDERVRQIAKWGLQTRPDGTHSEWTLVANMLRDTATKKTEDGTLTWFDILMEEVYEAVSETDAEPLETELVQCMAVIASWLQDRRRKREEALARAAFASAVITPRTTFEEYFDLPEAA